MGGRGWLEKEGGEQPFQANKCLINLEHAAHTNAIHLHKYDGVIAGKSDKRVGASCELGVFRREGVRMF